MFKQLFKRLTFREFCDDNEIKQTIRLLDIPYCLVHNRHMDFSECTLDAYKNLQLCEKGKITNQD